MRRLIRGGVCAGLVAVLGTGCFAPQPPRFGEGADVVPEEAERVDMPVRPGSDGDWTLRLGTLRIYGEGARLARLAGEQSKGWQATLPAEFALSSREPGAPHSALDAGGTAVLVGGREGHMGPSALAGVDPEHGGLSWRHELPPSTRVFLAQDGSSPTLVTSTCTARSCVLTGWEYWNGQRRWTRTVPGPVRVLDSCRTDGLGREPRPGDLCLPHLVTADRVGFVSAEAGQVSWNKGLRPSSGTVDRITQDGDRTVMVTAPAKGTCRAAALASGVDSGEGDRGWRQEFVWDQPQAQRDPVTGCRWDRRLPLAVGYSLVLPDKAGALVVQPYFGPLRPFRRLAPGEYAVSYGPWQQEVIRAAGRPDRPLSPTDTARLRPTDVGPRARWIGPGLWQDGRRLTLFAQGQKLWEATSDCRAHSAYGAETGFTYCDGDELVRVRPVLKD